MLRVEGMKLFRIRRSSLPLGFFGELLAALYMRVIAWIAAATQVHYILFPELGAPGPCRDQAATRHLGQAPGVLVLTPLLTGLVGAILVQSMGSGIVPILLAIAAAILMSCHACNRQLPRPSRRASCRSRSTSRAGTTLHRC